jgi:hypothetical protein
VAPEIAISDVEIESNEKVDVFSFALVLWEIVVGRRAYSPAVRGFAVQFMLRIVAGMRPEIEEMELLAEALIARCWEKAPDMRPSFANVVETLTEGGYAILSNADIEAVEQYVARIEEFEKRYPPPRVRA